MSWLNSILKKNAVKRTTESPGDIRDVLREAEIGDLDVPVRAEEDVFGLEIPVDDVLLVEVIESQGDFGSEELGDRVGEALRSERSGGGGTRTRNVKKFT